MSDLIQARLAALETTISSLRAELSDVNAKLFAVCTGAQIVAETSTRASADEALASHVGALECFHEPRRKYASAGLGLGVQLSTDELLDELKNRIAPTAVEFIEPDVRVRKVIRDELKPGGMLYRN